MKGISVTALLFLLPLSVCRGDVPVRTESLIWSILAFNGRDYSATFAPETSDTIFLLAGVDNFLSLRATLVYWWPLTSEWKTDTDSLNIQFPGTLELRDGRGATKKLRMVKYTYFNIRGEYELNWKVVTGGAAQEELQKYAALYNSYFKAAQEYQAKTAAYDQELQSLASRIQKLKDAHRDYASLLQRLRTLPAPVAPVAPSYYEVPPTVLQEAFILNLPTGRYSLRLVNADGTVMEGSEKAVLVQDALRTGGIGFEVIPSDKWTRPEESVTPSSVLYISGSADLYLRPFIENEFNDLGYQKTINNAARGNPHIAKWVRIQQVPHATIEIETPGAARYLLSEQPFYVEQSPGNSLGYTIVPWDPRGAHKDAQPNLVAFRVPLEQGARVLRFRARDGKGEVLAGSERQIRVVGPVSSPGLLIALALAPLLAMALVLVIRARSYTAERINES